ncbi:MAG: hypothetical protein LIP12_18575 [Clostridiales bacterium]|nr:hypothetical protein [Clostridiales bacterium]
MEKQAKKLVKRNLKNRLTKVGLNDRMVNAAEENGKNKTKKHTEVTEP